MPVFFTLMDRYPTPSDLAKAELDDVVGIIQHLGLQNQRAKKCIALAQTWLDAPLVKGQRYRVLHYPNQEDGKDISKAEGPIADETEDARVAWEVGHMPGIGAYAIDSWRIFCRDELRGVKTASLEPYPPVGDQKEQHLCAEWTKVLPKDKELRAYLRWRWLRCGWEWDPLSGERKKATEDVIATAERGGVVVEGNDGTEIKGDDFGISVPTIESAR